MGQERIYSPREIAALQAALRQVTDPVERRNLTYDTTRRIAGSEGTDPISRQNAARAAEKQVPGGDFMNDVQGGLYGAAEGLITPLAMEYLQRASKGFINPGTATWDNQTARMGGNILGSMYGLGKIGRRGEPRKGQGPMPKANARKPPSGSSSGVREQNPPRDPCPQTGRIPEA
jgi:hypothetical protein